MKAGAVLVSWRCRIFLGHPRGGVGEPLTRGVFAVLRVCHRGQGLSKVTPGTGVAGQAQVAGVPCGQA